MKAGIVGLVGCGKTVIFNAITGLNAPVHAYSTGSKSETNIASVIVNDERVNFLSYLYKPKKTVYANFELVDVTMPGKELGAKDNSKSELLNSLRQCDALIHVINCFEEKNGDDYLNAFKDIETEMILSDLSTVDKRLTKLTNDVKRAQGNEKSQLINEQELLQRFYSHLEEEKPIRNLELSNEELKIIKGYTFLSEKKMLVVANIGEKDLNAENNPKLAKLKAFLASNNIPYVEFCGQIEMELKQLPPSDKQELMESLGIKEEITDKLIEKCYKLLNLISFFTVGEDEVKAWTIPNNSVATEAARKIHSDIARGFIRAEVIHFSDLVKFGHWNLAKENGALKLEGKEYLMRDGDCVNFRYNV